MLFHWATLLESSHPANRLAKSMVKRGFPFSEKHPGNFRGICHIELAIQSMEQPQCGTAYNYNTREIVSWLALQNDDASWPYKQKWPCCFTLAIFKDKCRRKLFSSDKGFFVLHKLSRDEKHFHNNKHRITMLFVLCLTFWKYMHTSDSLSVLIQNLAVKSESALQESIKIA